MQKNVEKMSINYSPNFNLNKRSISEVKYIIFQSPAFIVDGIKTSDRLVLVHDYILKNYIEFFNQKEYIIYKLKK